MRLLGIKIDDKMRERIKAQSTKEGFKTLSEFIRVIVTKYLNEVQDR